ncbi:hypothetical protein FY150_24765 (plasmid) [Agrobacterium tumefaciens]|nr:hypothetical protein FY150_24765 [Agrobacterium tumefaciens]
MNITLVSGAWQARFAIFCIILGVNLTLSVAGAASEDKGRGWILSGFDLVAALEGRPLVGNDRALSSVQAKAYISGVADVTSGARWCGAGTILPHELVDRAYTYLRNLPSSRLEGNASSLVVDGLAEAFPCRTD